MRNKIASIGILVLVSILILACSNKPEQKELKGKIDLLEKELNKTAMQGLNPKKATDMLDAYLAFVKNYPEMPECAEYLFKAAEVSSALKKTDEAIGYYEKIGREYPQYKKLPECLFLQGFLYETQLNRIESARQKYTEFIKKYPNHTLAKDAQASIDNLGKTPDQIIKEFEKKAVQEKDNSSK